MTKNKQCEAKAGCLQKKKGVQNERRKRIFVQLQEDRGNGSLDVCGLCDPYRRYRSNRIHEQ